MKRTMHLSVTLLLCLAAGCSSVGTGNPSTGGGGPAGGPGDLGVTPGGVQDIDFAREQIANGRVPSATSITVEGLLSQHDLPTIGAPCEDMLCLRPALAYAPSLATGENEYWLHLGMTSGLDFERPPLDITIVIDRSGSMVGDMDETNEAAIDILRQLGPGDRASVLAFNESVSTIVQHGPVMDLDGVSAEVRGITAEGGWDIDPALEDALEIQREAGESPERIRRVVVLSCGYPAASQFEPIASRAAEERIGFTFVGILLGFDASLGDVLGQTRGGNYFYTSSLESITSLFDEDLDFMLTPLTYDMRVKLDLSESFSVERAYGVPGATDWQDLEVTTTFLSRRRGGIVVRLRSEGRFDQDLGDIALSYTPEPAHGWDGEVDESLELRIQDSTEVHYGSDGARKAVALTNAAEQMSAACEQHQVGDAAGAQETMGVLVEYLAAEVEALDDDGLRTELALAESLLGLL